MKILKKLRMRKYERYIENKLEHAIAVMESRKSRGHGDGEYFQRTGSCQGYADGLQ